jgi:hypothetical protein
VSFRQAATRLGNGLNAWKPSAGDGGLAGINPSNGLDAFIVKPVGSGKLLNFKGVVRHRSCTTAEAVNRHRGRRILDGGLHFANPAHVLSFEYRLDRAAVLEEKEG